MEGMEDMEKPKSEILASLFSMLSTISMGFHDSKKETELKGASYDPTHSQRIC